MKIITDNSAFIQKNDLIYLNSSDISIPAELFTQVFGSGVTVINDRNRFDFVRFDDEDSIKFIKGIDWIVDYDEVKDLDEESIMRFANSIIKEQTSIASDYNSMTDEEKANHTGSVIRCNCLEYKFYSLRDFLLFKKGFLKIQLPEGVDYPYDMNRGNRIKKLFKRKERNNK